MNPDIKKEMLASIENFRLPAYDEIPDVGLYLEQTTAYIMSFLEPLQDITLTGSMISNYVKQKIIVNPTKKLYHREQIAYLFFMAIAKSVLSLDNIRSIIAIQQQNCDSRTAYNYFCTEFEQILQDIFTAKLSTSTPDDDSDEKIMLHNLIIAAAHKIYLDSYFYHHTKG